MTAVPPDLRRAHWRKSSHSDGGQTNCLEVCADFPGLVPVRDSKNPDEPAILVTATAWAEFVAFAAQR
ncbi:DUF397 domain-containing protein [Streptomyces sp. NBC_00102]|uniref:DUF397 domain-containing protein n=1 Tax=Streptomyces sp. NBC_00102 TaxID=2975652 RepID=UPI00224D04FD|nr:DUF397 domain-containing protein [Streptomyces sp. NBC_00102]MCX5398926.1 DUF397 domain-containing protein [Streptomyces sp. NBC_00102]